MTLPSHSTEVIEAGEAKSSRVFWQIDWAEHLPRTITEDGISLHLSSIDAALPFISAHYAELFEQDLERERFLTEAFDGAKLRYFRVADVFEIKHADRTIGLFVGAPSDWSTYYLRTMAVLAPYQGRQLPKLFLPFVFDQLTRVGVRRFEAETSPSNLASVLILTRMRFNMTGTVLSERWGALLRFTKFVDERAEAVFLDKFCTGVRYQERRRKDRPVTQ